MINLTHSENTFRPQYKVAIYVMQYRFFLYDGPWQAQEVKEKGEKNSGEKCNKLHCW
jgi:hypothetical protein